MTNLTKSNPDKSTDLTICRTDDELFEALEHLPCRDLPQFTDGTSDPSLVSNSNDYTKGEGKTLWDVLRESRKKVDRNGKVEIPEEEGLIRSVSGYDGLTPKTGRRWRSLSDEQKLWYYAFAVRELGAPILFSLVPTDDIQRRMRKSPFGPREFMMRRMDHQFADVPFYFALELTKESGKVHVHGALAQTAQKDADIAQGLHSVTGDERKQIGKSRKYFYNRHACHFQRPNFNKQSNHMKGDLGWAEYCGKNLKETARLLQRNDKMIARTQLVNQCAELIFRCFTDLKMKEALEQNNSIKTKDKV